MNRVKKLLVAAGAVLFIGTGLTACTSSADVASNNLSKEADQFRIYRRIILYNSITDKNILVVQGFCSLGNHDSADRVTVTCKVGNGYKKDHFFKSDNTLVFSDQLDAAGVSTSHYEVIFKPSTAIPDIKLN